MQHANVSPYVSMAAMSGDYSDHMTPAGLGAAGQTIPDLSASDITLGRMVGEKHSSRRQASKDLTLSGWRAGNYSPSNRALWDLPFAHPPFTLPLPPPRSSS